MSRKTHLLSPPAFLMKAVIICDDFAFTANAAATLARVGHQASVNVQWITKCLPINALNDVTLAENALLEASDAHLILFPAQCAQSSNSFLFDWLGRWAAIRKIRDAALGVINVGNLKSANLAFPELSRFAGEHGLSLIVDEEPPMKNPAKVFVHFLGERKVPLPIVQTYLAGFATRPCYRSFGTNE